MNQLQLINIAGRFLTRLPFPDPGEFDGEAHAKATSYYAVIGLIMGLILWLGSELLSGVNTGVLAFVLLAAWVWTSGALHLDGLADSADAWVGGLGDRERTLEIMKDPHNGVMGTTTVTLLLLGKFSALSVLLAADQALYLIFVLAFSRAVLPILFLLTPYARSEGLGSKMLEHTNKDYAYGIAAGLVVVAFVTIGFIHSLALVITAAIVLYLLRKTMLTRLGGTTGDTAGATVELAELALLLMSAALI